MVNKFSQANYRRICRELALIDPDLAGIMDTYGYPPLWSRPNTFETLVHIILEQQVSLASALSALNKLRERLGEITPAGIMLLTDEELKACYCSRQKSGYIRHLAEAIWSGQLVLAELEELPETVIRTKLTALKGIGHWTTDIYLMFVLKFSDIFPVGDLAAVSALKRLKQLPRGFTRKELLLVADKWKPNRTIATMLLWHFYLSAPKSRKL